VVSDKPQCGGVDFARAVGLPVLPFPPGCTEEQAEALAAALQAAGARLVCLAGFLKLLPAPVVAAFPRAVLNMHPALLPAFGGRGMYGARVHAAVLASGATVSGATVHFVDAAYDRGVILAQTVVPVRADDSAEALAARVLRQEWRLFPAAVGALCAGRVTWREDGVPCLPEGAVEVYSQDLGPS